MTQYTEQELLEFHRPDIATLLRANHTIADITKYLNNHDLHLSERTVRRQLQAWREDPDFPQGRKPKIHEERSRAILDLSTKTAITDTEICKVLALRNLNCSSRTVRRDRIKAGIRRRDNSDQERHERYQHILSEVRDAILHDSTTQSYGRELMTTYLQQYRGISARYDDVKEALYTVYRELNLQRSFRNPKARRPFASYPGPDWMWCVDGHDKTSRFGIAVYAAIDAYSRRIMYVYVGNNNRAQIAVLKMYLEAVKSIGWCPRYIRSDRGTETLLMADVHHTLYKKAQQIDGLPFHEAQRIDIKECYMYGTSTSNIRIESWWFRLLSSQTRVWRDYFNWLVRSGIYRLDIPAHRVVFLYWFMPILRASIDQFAKIHNYHKIRKQKNRPHHIAGRPQFLWNSRLGDDPDFNRLTDRQGFACPEQLVNAHLALLEHYNLDTFITNASMHWCDNYVSQHNLPQPPQGRDFLQAHGDAPYACPTWFPIMLAAATAYVIGGGELSEAEVPRGARDWISQHQPSQTLSGQSDELHNDLANELSEEEDLDALEADEYAEDEIWD